MAGRLIPGEARLAASASDASRDSSSADTGSRPPGTHSLGPSFTGKLDSFRTRRKAVTGTGDRTWLRSSTARRLSTGRAAGQAPAQIRKKVWARSGAWPPRAQTERARSLDPFADDHAVRFLSNARTQL